MDALTRLDFSLLYSIQENLRCGFLDFLMPKLSFIGNLGAVWILAAAALCLTRRHRKKGVFLFVGLLIGLLVGNLLLKNLVARPRPCWLDPSVTLLIPVPKDFSFPSGHTLSSVTGATVLTLTDRRFAIPAIPLALLIGFSRLYLFVHFPSDVFFALLLGIAIGTSVFFLGSRLTKPTGTKKKN